MLAHQKHIVFIQRRLHLLAPAGDAALDQRPHGTDGTKHAAHDVIHTAAGAQRVARAAGHVGQPAHHLHHHVERRAVVVGPGQKTFVADIDQARVGLAERGVIEPVLGHGAGLEVFGHHISRAGEPTRQRRALGLVQVNGNALLVAVEHRKETGTGAQQMAGAVALDRLHLDHLGPQVGQHHAAGRPHHHVGELHHAQPGERQGGVAGLISRHAGIVQRPRHGVIV